MHGHERPITHLKYSPDGDVFFSASKDSTPTMWRAKDGERLGVFYGHNGSVSALIPRVTLSVSAHVFR